VIFRNIGSRTPYLDFLGEPGMGRSTSSARDAHSAEEEPRARRSGTFVRQEPMVREAPARKVSGLPASAQVLSSF